MTENIQLNGEFIDNLIAIRNKLMDVRVLHIQKTGTELVVPSNERKQYQMLCEVFARYQKFGLEAKATAHEWVATIHFANFVIRQFHLLVGTPEDKIPVLEVRLPN